MTPTQMSEVSQMRNKAILKQQEELKRGEGTNLLGGLALNEARDRVFRRILSLRLDNKQYNRARGEHAQLEFERTGKVVSA